MFLPAPPNFQKKKLAEEIQNLDPWPPKYDGREDDVIAHRKEIDGPDPDCIHRLVCKLCQIKCHIEQAKGCGVGAHAEPVTEEVKEVAPEESPSAVENRCHSAYYS